MKKIFVFVSCVFCLNSAKAQWKLSANTPLYPSTELSFPTLKAAYILSSLSILYKSADTGNTWTKIFDFGPFSSVRNLCFINADTGFVTAAGTVFRTFDGGNSWTSVFSGVSSWVSRFELLQQNLFLSYTSNDTTYMVASSDFGNSWSVLLTHYQPNNQPFIFSFVDTQTAFFINADSLAQIYKTQDRFQSIDTIMSFSGDMQLQEKLHFTDTLNGYFYGSYGSLSHPVRTANGGVPMQPIDLDGFGVLPVLDLDFNTSKLYAASLYGKIFTSVNHGQTWSEQSTPVSKPIISIAFADEHHGIAISGTKVLITDIVTKVKEPLFETEINIYPNPAADRITISYAHDVKIHSIELINMSGKTLKTFKPEKTLDVSNIAAGNYLLRIFTDKGNTIQKITVQ